MIYFMFLYFNGTHETWVNSMHQTFHRKEAKQFKLLFAITAVENYFT